MKNSRKKGIILSVVLVVSAVAAIFVFSDRVTDIGTEHRFVWDSSVVDTEKTTAVKVLHSPVQQETAFTADMPWEGSTADGFNVVRCDDGYRMYYSVYDTKDCVRICCAYSADGIIWEKPSLNKVSFDGSTDNNIIFGEDSGITGGFFAFRDSNAKAEADGKYKAIALKNDNSFSTYVSADGISWTEKGTMGKNIISDAGACAQISSVFWNEEQQKYYCYFTEDDGQQNIKLTTSENFEKWTKPKKIHCSSSYSIRTANIMPYYRGEGMLIGLPLRTTELEPEAYNANFPDNRVKSEKITDTVFMYSTDGKDFSATDEAWLTPGPQNGSNWVFGDSFVANGIVETPSIHYAEGQDSELSLYVAENMLSEKDTELVRYTMRTDGFASYRAPYDTKKLVTKPLKFDGSRMTLNFSTSTDGYVYVRILNSNGKPFEDIVYTREDGTEYSVPKYTSYKLIGDRVDREVVFNGDISELTGKTVVLEFYMSDADIYSFRFDDLDYTADGRWQPEEIEIRDYGDFVYPDTGEPLDIGTERQLFRDNYIVDVSETDAVHVSHSPVRKEELFRTDLPWEGDNCDFYVIMDDVDSDGKAYHRMYYLGWDSSDFTDIRVCYAYSYDGISWIKPDLGLHSYTDKNTGKTYTDTNIVLYTEEEIFDNFFVMKDTREGVPDSQRYKAICQGRYDQLGYPSYGLWAWVSADGLHWTKTHRVLPQLEEWFGSFDSVNSLVWDEKSEQFFTYFRVRETQVDDGTEWIDFRKIYGATGEDFKPFEEETMFELNYGDNSPLFEMYTNNIVKYYRAPQIFIGFPTRFSRNSEWEKNYEYLSDPQTRLENYNSGQLTRTLSMTDTMFMTSRDGYTWDRQNEAYITPGPEYQANWIYGNCYPAYGLTETAADNPAEDNQISTYLFEGKFYKAPSVFYRYVLRLDGFGSYKGNADTQKVTTKPFVLKGNELYVNFRTSAAGEMQVNILDENGQLIEGCSSAVLIGDNTDRKVFFSGDLSQLEGRTVKLEFVLRDAEIYSFKFQ